MEKEFVSYEIALALKELGFNKPCFGWYNWTGTELHLTNNSYVDINPTEAPLYQQVFEWFRVNYGYVSYIKESTKGTYTFYIERFDDEKFYNSEKYSLYRESEIACIEKLIGYIKRNL